MNDESFELGLELALAFGFAEPGDPLGRGRELHALPGQARADPERGSDVCLAGAGRAEQDHVLACRAGSRAARGARSPSS